MATDGTFLFIVGHVGASGTEAGSETLIAAGGDVAAALRVYNNSTRGARGAKLAGGARGIVCACMHAPTARQLDTDALLKLWRTSRKLHCRVRAGIELAHALALPCAVERSVLASAAARKAMPQLVERALDAAYEPPARRRRRRRGRRVSARDRAIAAHPRVVAMRSDDELGAMLRTLAAHSARVPPTALWKTDAELDALNTLSDKAGESRCFTRGKTQPKSRPKARVGLRQSSAALRERAAALREDEDDDTDDDDAAADEPGADVCQTPPLADAALDALEIDLYAADEARARRAQTALAARDVCADTRMRAADTARIECASASSGALDNAALAARADDCYTDANEFIYARPLARVKLHRARAAERRCVCGAAQRRAGALYVCAARCGRTSRHTLLYRTDVAALKKAALRGGAPRATRRERRALRTTMRNAELRRPIDEFGASVVEEARHALGLDRSPARKRARTGAPVPREAALIDAALAGALAQDQ